MGFIGFENLSLSRRLFSSFLRAGGFIHLPDQGAIFPNIIVNRKFIMNKRKKRIKWYI